MPNRQDLLKRIRLLLDGFERNIQLMSSHGLTNSAVLAEGSFISILNLVYDHQLSRTSLETPNSPLIDLIDRRARIGYELTTQSQTEKIREIHRRAPTLANQVDKLVVFFLKRKAPSAPRPSGNFVPSKVPVISILDFARLISDISKLPISSIETIANLLDRELSGWRAALRLITRGNEEQVSGSVVPTKVEIGALNRIRWAATPEESALNAEKYAQILAEMLGQDDDEELTLALFGHWGRGKTFLMERVRDEFEGKDKKAMVRVIFFSAWRFPTKPEVWVHFYETIANQMRGKGFKGWIKALVPTLRAGIEKKGYNKLIVIWLWLMVGVMPKAWLVGQVLPTFTFHPLHTLSDGWVLAQSFWEWLLTIPVILMALYFTVMFFRSVWNAGKSLHKEFLGATRHSEKLGLQATIGEDLKALLKGWVWRKPVGFAWRWLAYSFCAGLLLTVLWSRTDWASWLNYPSRVAAVIIAAFFPFVIFLTAPPRRILVVVDDLDRCSNEHLVSVIESIRLMTEDREVGTRARVACLVEEGIFKHALWKKYRHLVAAGKESVPLPAFDAKQIIRENMEKLFTVSLRLRPLTEREVSDLLAKYEGGTLNAAEMLERVLSRNDHSGQAETTETKEGDGEEVDAEAAREIPDQGQTENQPTANSSTSLEPNLVEISDELSLQEREALLLNLLFRKGAALSGVPLNLGPRTIRSYILRYKMARLIMKKLDIKFEPRSGVQEWSGMMSLLARRMLGEETTSSQLRAELAEIVEEVS